MQHNHLILFFFHSVQEVHQNVTPILFLPSFTTLSMCNILFIGPRSCPCGQSMGGVANQRCCVKTNNHKVWSTMKCWSMVWSLWSMIVGKIRGIIVSRGGANCKLKLLSTKSKGRHQEGAIGKFKKGQLGRTCYKQTSFIDPSTSVGLLKGYSPDYLLL